MAREINPNREKARQIYVEHAGNITNRKIAEALGEDEKKIAVWKQRDNWTNTTVSPTNVIQQKKANKKNVVQQKEDHREEFKLEDIDAELTEKQRLFCLYYVKYWNAGKAAKKAGYECSYEHGFNEIGYQLLHKYPRIKKEIDRLKQHIRSGVGLEAMAVLQKYVDIAFAEITDYVTFGQKEVPVISMFGPVKDEEGNIQTKMVNFVDFSPSASVDGSLISEVKQGKEGVSLKLHDKMKALEKLEKYTDLLPDRHKRRIETEKLKIEKERLELEKTKITIKDPNSDIGITVHFNIPRPDSAELKL